MKASEFMTKIDRKEVEFNSNYESGTFGWEFDFAEAYANHELGSIKQENEGLKLQMKSLQDAVNELLQENEELKELIYVDDDECNFDHHGFCQTHMMNQYKTYKCGMLRIRELTQNKK